MITEIILTSVISLGTFFCQQHGKSAEYQRQIEQQKIQFQQQQLEKDKDRTFELCKEQQKCDLFDKLVSPDK